MNVRAKLNSTLNAHSARKQRFLANVPAMLRGSDFAHQMPALASVPDEGRTARTDVYDTPVSSNPLLDYFNAHKEGPGIWKWKHYFDIYHRHFSPFVGREVHILEVGIYSGGSLDMWKAYFGPRCHIYGVDIEPACKAYEGDHVRVFIGDQADRSFWNEFKTQAPRIDIVVDDGGHLPEQQIVTLEEMLPHLSPGGVYLCEDVQAEFNDFAAYVRGLSDSLNAQCLTQPLTPATQQIDSPVNAFQRAIHSVHLYPYVTVIEKNAQPVEQLVAPKHGTEWQPHL